jgi:hypothetical protein
VPGAITVSNKHQQEFFLETITIDGFACGPVHFPCNSWVQSKKYHPAERIFFSNKVIMFLVSELSLFLEMHDTVGYVFFVMLLSSNIQFIKVKPCVTCG